MDTSPVYAPTQNGIPIGTDARYVEYSPSEKLSDVVAVFWELQTTKQLPENFVYTVMPDACIDIVFDVSTPTNLPLLMSPHVTIETLELGKSFHYAGIRFKPGVFTASAPDVQRIVGGQLAIDRFNEIDASALAKSLAKAVDSDARLQLLETFCSQLKARGYTRKNPVIEHVVHGLYAGESVEHIARSIGYSERQLRRITQKQTGYTPVQLHRILRFQAALSENDFKLRFADESHLIKEFRSITGVPYRKFVSQFNVVQHSQHATR